MRYNKKMQKSNSDFKMRQEIFIILNSDFKMR